MSAVTTTTCDGCSGGALESPDDDSCSWLRTGPYQHTDVVRAPVRDGGVKRESPIALKPFKLSPGFIISGPCGCGPTTPAVVPPML